MKTLQISEQKARELYKSGSGELRSILEESFGKDFFSQKITDRVKTYEDACRELSMNPLDENKLMKLGLTKHDIAYQKLVTKTAVFPEPAAADTNMFWSLASITSFCFGVQFGIFIFLLPNLHTSHLT